MIHLTVATVTLFLRQKQDAGENPPSHNTHTNCNKSTDWAKLQFISLNQSAMENIYTSKEAIFLINDQKIFVPLKKD